MIDGMHIYLQYGPADEYYYLGIVSKDGARIGEVTGPTLFGVVDQLCQIIAMHESAEQPRRQ